MFLKNKNIIFKIRRSKVTDYAALINVMGAQMSSLIEYPQPMFWLRNKKIKFLVRTFLTKGLELKPILLRWLPK